MEDFNSTIYEKFGFKNATKYSVGPTVGSLTLSGPTGGAYNTDRICMHPRKSYKML